MTFKAGDQVTLHKPAPPFPTNWPHLVSGAPFGIFDEFWEEVDGKTFTISEVDTYLGCPAARVGPTIFEEMRTLRWPFESLRLVIAKASKNSPIPCDCPWEVVLNQGCKKPEHC